MTRVFTVARTRLHSEALAHWLATADEISVVGEARTAANAVGPIRELRADVVLIDAAAGDCIDEIRTVVTGAPNARVVPVAMPESEDCIVACAEAGIAGYVPRDASLEELAEVIRRVPTGDAPCPARVAAWLMQGLHALSAERASSRVVGRLTRREAEILALVGEGLPNKEIARRLQIEVATVKNHVHNILEKLGVHRRGEAVARLRGLDLG